MHDRNHCCEYERMANMNEQEVAVKLTEVEARCKSNTHRLDNVEKRQIGQYFDLAN